ncbi:MAG: ribonuclease HI [Verrucomicrobiaceae bacterium]|nr:ribonuclease HI [Verrucomicrobiaceae bacterium]
MKKVIIFSDGGCHGNPGPGAWAAVLQYGKHVREITGGIAATTNNRMELMAAIESLNLLKEACDIDFHTDSEYVRNGITQWLTGWKRNGWRTAAKKPVKNADLWQQLDAANARHTVRWHWVKGHAGNDLNERCDELVQEAIAKVKNSHSSAELASALKVFKEAEG